MWDYRARIIDVHDGDTVTVVLDLGLAVTVTATVRLLDAWAPELRQPGGVKTRDHLAGIVDAHPGEWPWRVTTQRIRSDAHEVTTLGRYVASIRPNVVGQDVPTLTEAVNGFVLGEGYGGGTGA